MRKSVTQLVAGAALLGVGVAGGWAAGAAGSTPKPASAPPTATTDSGVRHLSQAAFTGQLVAFDSCARLLDALHARGRAMVGPYGLQGQNAYLPEALAPKSAGGDFASSAAGAPSAPSAGATSSSGTAAAPLTHSTTNTQVDDVDEPDVVKTDGRYLVSLDGQLLHIVDVRTAKLHATLALPHPGSELLLAGDRVVVLSGNGSSSGAGGGGEGGAIAPMSSAYPYYNRYGSSTSTTATVVDIADPDAPRVVRSWAFDAGELAARVVGGTMRLVLTSPPPSATWATPRDNSSAEKARATKINQSIVDATPLDAWVPHWTGDDGQAHRLSACDAVATPARANGVGVVTVASLDLQSPQPGAGTSVFGAGDTAYAEGQHLYVSDTGTSSLIGSADAGVTSAPPSAVHLLEFDLSDVAQARYLAAGSVPGQLHDSYALSEYAGKLRVTTTTYDSGNNTSTGISVLERHGDKLVTVGRLGGLGTGEQVYAVRYLDDRGYVVTFQRVDPLHVIDLSDPAHPVLRGTLTMPGYSSLLLPLPGHRLLGIGQSVQTSVPRCIGGVGCGSSTGNASNGESPSIVEPDGLQLALFDVADAAHPKLLSRRVLAGAYAPAVSDPHAVTLDPSRGFAVLPSSSGLLGVQLSGSRLTTTAAAFTTPYSAQAERTIIAGQRLFELTDRGVAIRNLPALHQTGWLGF